MHNATPKKLRDGTWGAILSSPKNTVKENDMVQVTARSGKTWTSAITKVIWGNQKVTIVATRLIPTPTKKNGCRYCRRSPSRTAQIWEECDHCGTEPIYM